MQTAAELRSHYAALKARLYPNSGKIAPPSLTQNPMVNPAVSSVTSGKTKRPPIIYPKRLRRYRHPIGPVQPKVYQCRVRSIVSIVSANTGVPVEAIMGPRRHVEMVEARQIAGYLARKTADISFPLIGRKLGGRDHTTIIHAFQKIEARIAADEVFGKRIAGLIRQVEARR